MGRSSDLDLGGERDNWEALGSGRGGRRPALLDAQRRGALDGAAERQMARTPRRDPTFFLTPR